jgi:hypothetical protein
MMRLAFPALQAQPRGADTVLTGPLPDQAALYAYWPKSRHSDLNCSKSAACLRTEVTTFLTS